MRIAICDDDPNTIEQLSHYIHTWMEQEKLSLPEIAQFNGAESFLFHWSPTADFDLLFLDIAMGNISGIELAKIIRKINQDISIVFITGSREHILEGYEVDALHYILKPISRNDCFKCLDRAQKKLTKAVEQSLIIETSKKVQRITYSDILYIESVAHYITLHS